MSKQYLYRHFNSKKELLYVGISVNPLIRTQQHKQKHWFNDIANITIKSYTSRKAVLLAEEKAIKQEKPKHNLVHNKKVATKKKLNILNWLLFYAITFLIIGVLIKE